MFSTSVQEILGRSALCMYGVARDEFKERLIRKKLIPEESFEGRDRIDGYQALAWRGFAETFNKESYSVPTWFGYSYSAAGFELVASRKRMNTKIERVQKGERKIEEKIQIGEAGIFKKKPIYETRVRTEPIMEWSETSTPYKTTEIIANTDFEGSVFEIGYSVIRPSGTGGDSRPCQGVYFSLYLAEPDYKNLMPLIESNPNFTRRILKGTFPELEAIYLGDIKFLGDVILFATEEDGILFEDDSVYGRLKDNSKEGRNTISLRDEDISKFSSGKLLKWSEIEPAP